jgi:hypothetical protein
MRFALATSFAKARMRGPADPIEWPKVRLVDGTAKKRSAGSNFAPSRSKYVNRRSRCAIQKLEPKWVPVFALLSISPRRHHASSALASARLGGERNNFRVGTSVGGGVGPKIGAACLMSLASRTLCLTNLLSLFLGASLREFNQLSGALKALPLVCWRSTYTGAEKSKPISIGGAVIAVDFARLALSQEAKSYELIDRIADQGARATVDPLKFIIRHHEVAVLKCAVP